MDPNQRKHQEAVSDDPGPGSSGQRPSQRITGDRGPEHASPGAGVGPSPPPTRAGPRTSVGGAVGLRRLPASCFQRGRLNTEQAEGRGTADPDRSAHVPHGRAAQPLGAELHLATAHRVGKAKLGPHFGNCYKPEIHSQARQCQRTPTLGHPPSGLSPSDRPQGPPGPLGRNTCSSARPPAASPVAGLGQFQPAACWPVSFRAQA